MENFPIKHYSPSLTGGGSQGIVFFLGEKNSPSLLPLSHPRSPTPFGPPSPPPGAFHSGNHFDCRGRGLFQGIRRKVEDDPEIVLGGQVRYAVQNSAARRCEAPGLSPVNRSTHFDDVPGQHSVCIQESNPVLVGTGMTAGPR